MGVSSELWQNLPKTRRHLIRIEGTKLADLDYQDLFLRLAYCRVGIEPPKGDLYEKLGFEGRFRPGIKALVSAFLFARRRRSTIPAKLKGELPAGLTAKQARAAILSAHPSLEPVLETGIGYSLMHTESEMLRTALEDLLRDGIVALPMHDGLMVKRSAAKRAKAALIEAAKQKAGFSLPVTQRKIAQNVDSPPSSCRCSGRCW